MVLKLVNDISSIEATLRSNHTLRKICFLSDGTDVINLSGTEVQILDQFNTALEINRLPGEAGRSKVLQTQLHSERRAQLAELQGVSHSLYSEIDPLHSPEVLALVDDYHGHGELYIALKSSIAGVISTVNEKECLKQENSYYRAKIAEYSAKLEANEAKIAVIEAAEAPVVDIGSESRCNKRRKAS